MSTDPLPEIAASRNSLREALVARGFTDDGDVLCGSVNWTAISGRDCRTAIVIQLGENFPFAPPLVRIGSEKSGYDTVEATFHLELNGTLCLYNQDSAFYDGSWSEAETLLSQIVGWLVNCDAGWPDDEDCDLERYLRNSERFVVYDGSELSGVSGTVAVDKINNLTRVHARRMPPPPKVGSPPQRRNKGRLAWVCDLGALAAPIREWGDLEILLGEQATIIERYIRSGYVEILLFRYQRGTADGILVLHAVPSNRGITLLGCVSADDSLDTRLLRAGTDADLFAKEKIAIVGCGAVGSFIADLLFRSGVHVLTLIDPQRLQPGNVIRHVASSDGIGLYKVEAVFNHLTQIGLPMDRVTCVSEAILTAEDALDLLKGHTIVIDASADARVSGLLAYTAKRTDAQLITTCLQREGGIARVDRWPLEVGEEFLDVVPKLDLVGSRERGCSDPVSLTPPFSVMTAAALTVRVVLDRINGTHELPATVLEVLQVQPDAPYDHLGQLSVHTSPAVTV